MGRTEEPILCKDMSGMVYGILHKLLLGALAFFVLLFLRYSLTRYCCGVKNYYLYHYFVANAALQCCW